MFCLWDKNNINKNILFVLEINKLFNGAWQFVFLGMCYIIVYREIDKILIYYKRQK